jgi:hypothetical protein
LNLVEIAKPEVLHVASGAADRRVNGVLKYQAALKTLNPE